MSYTDEELHAVARVVWPGHLLPLMNARASLRDWWKYRASAEEREFAVRLALAHPERAGEALGPGWRVEKWWGEAGKGVVCIFAGEGFELIVREGGERFDLDTGVTWWVIPPEFDAALARARLIAAARQRIEAEKEASSG